MSDESYIETQLLYLGHLVSPTNPKKGQDVFIKQSDIPEIEPVSWHNNNKVLRYSLPPRIRRTLSVGAVYAVPLNSEGSIKLTFTFQFNHHRAQALRIVAMSQAPLDIPSLPQTLRDELRTVKAAMDRARGPQRVALLSQINYYLLKG